MAAWPSPSAPPSPSGVSATRYVAQQPSSLLLHTANMTFQDSWRQGENPLLFDASFQPKEAYNAIVDVL